MIGMTEMQSTGVLPRICDRQKKVVQYHKDPQTVNHVSLGNLSTAICNEAIINLNGGV